MYHDAQGIWLQATAPVKLQVEEALSQGIGSFQELLQQQNDTLRLLKQDYSSYAKLACVHPSVVMAHREDSESNCGNSPTKERVSRSTRGIMRQVTLRAFASMPH